MSRAGAPPAATPVSPAILAAAYAVPVCVLPSAAWRLHAVLWGNQACFNGGGEKAYVVSLSVVSLAAACLTIGLVSRWGEVLPDWLPRVGGRTVNGAVVTVAAGLGVALIFTVYAYAVLNPIFGWRQPPPYHPACPPPDQTSGAWAAYAAYAPLLLWGPLLLIVTVSYHRRRTRGDRR